MKSNHGRSYFYFQWKLILLLFIFFITIGVKDIEHHREKSDNSRKERTPRYELVPVTPPSEEGNQEHDPIPPSKALPRLSPSEFPQNQRPPEYLPYQGMLPRLEKKNPIMQQDEGNFMSQPMPQRNPGPSSVFPERPRHRIPD